MTCLAQRELKFSIVATSDVHGNFFPYDFINQKPGTGSLSRVSTYLKQERERQGRHNVLYMDNGDILQGQPTVYYYNYVDTLSPHPAATMLGYMTALCSTVGNHDIEVGPAAMKRWMDECGFVTLGANVYTANKKGTSFTSYVMENVQGVQVGVLGLVTPSIPNYLPESSWKNMDFRDMVATAKRVVPMMQRAGRADVVVLLVHAGAGPRNSQATMLEHAAIQLAEQVPNVDIVFAGHDHRLLAERVTNKATGKTVIVLNPGSNADFVAQADLTVRLNEKNKVLHKSITGRIVNVNPYEPDPEFLATFQKEFKAVKAYTEEVVGTNSLILDTRTPLFGSSPFVDFIHDIQLKQSGADISFAAPLSFDAEVKAGDIRVADLFNLYKYENYLYVLKMTGLEVKKYLEESYDQWVNTMSSPDDHLLRFSPDADNKKEKWQRLQHSIYNFDSAAGIKYTVDVRRPKGQKVTIEEMENGEIFDPTRTYRVAMSSYRAIGGGGLLEKAGITRADAKSRVVWQSPHDMRHYVKTEIQRQGTIRPRARHQWKFTPEGWADNAGERDAQRLFQ